MKKTKNKICKNCGHPKSAHKLRKEKKCLHLKEPFGLCVKENICGCENFEEK